MLTAQEITPLLSIADLQIKTSENNEYGVWGGVYLSSGSIDKSKNLHKTQESWKRLKKKNVY